jgi:glycosyltransferase involved in cell wall biosynthesis
MRAGGETRDGFELVRLPVTRVPVVRTALDVNATVRTLAALSPRPDVLLCFQTFVSGFAGVRAWKRAAIPAVVWVRGEDEYRLGRGRMRWISPWVWRHARGVLVQSEAVRTELLAELGARSAAACNGVAAKIEVVPNGLDLPPPPIPSAGTGVLAVGRLVPQKRMDVVMDASAACGLPLTIAGDGPERPALEARPTAGLTTFEGAASRDRLAQLYLEAGCVVLASSRGEGLPNALLEAMSYARPVIATPIAGVRDLVRDGENGLLIPPGDPAALAAALRLLQSDRQLAARLGAAGRATAEGFSWDAARARLEPLLERWASRADTIEHRRP